MRTLAEVLRAHRAMWSGGGTLAGCGCGWIRDIGTHHADHLADVVSAWLREAASDEGVTAAVDSALEDARDSFFVEGDLPSEYRPYTTAALGAFCEQVAR